MSNKTEAAVLFKLNSNLKLVKLNLPEPSKNQVLVKIYFSSICRSQLMEIYSGRKNFKDHHIRIIKTINLIKKYFNKK